MEKKMAAVDDPYWQDGTHICPVVNTPTAELFLKLSTHQQLNCFQSCQHANSWTVFKVVNTPTAELFSKLLTHQELNCFQRQSGKRWQRCGGAPVGSPGHKDTILNWTEQCGLFWTTNHKNYLSSLRCWCFFLQWNSASSKRLVWGMQITSMQENFPVYSVRHNVCAFMCINQISAFEQVLLARKLRQSLAFPTLGFPL